MPMAGWKAILKQLDQVNLTASLCQHIEILVMDMDITVDMGCCDILRQNIIINEILRTFWTVFQHCTHGRITINICVLSLDIFIHGTGIGQLGINIHQIGFRLTDLRVLSTIENVCLGSLRIIKTDQRLLHNILYMLNCDNFIRVQLTAHFLCQVRQISRFHHLIFNCHIGSADSIQNLHWIKRHHLAISFLYLLYHPFTLPL